jgi:hypothetical protein
MTNIPFNIDYYILGGDGELLDARSAQVFAVDSETRFEEVEDLVEYHYDDMETLDVMSTLRFLPNPSTKSVDVGALLTHLANDHSSTLTMDERKALLSLRDELTEVYR